MGRQSKLFISYCGVIYPWECDHQGHLNVMHYVSKFDEATWRMFARIGMSRRYLDENGRGVAAVRQTISYRRELCPGDLVTVWTGILEINPRQIRFYHEMTHDENGEIASTTVITGVCMDQATRKACLFPDDIVNAAEKLIVDIVPIT